MCKKITDEQGSRLLDLQCIIGKDDISPFLNRQASCASLIIHTKPSLPSYSRLCLMSATAKVHTHTCCGAVQVGDLSTALGPRVDAALRKGNRSYSPPCVVRHANTVYSAVLSETLPRYQSQELTTHSHDFPSHPWPNWLNQVPDL